MGYNGPAPEGRRPPAPPAPPPPRFGVAERPKPPEPDRPEGLPSWLLLLLLLS